MDNYRESEIGESSTEFGRNLHWFELTIYIKMNEKLIKYLLIMI